MMSAFDLRRRCQAGFTLLEVLISTAIMAIVLSSVYGAYRATFHTISGADRQVMNAAAARMILERVTGDIEAVYTGDEGYFIAEKNDLGDARADTLKFVSAAHLVFNREQIPAGRTTIEYTIREVETGGFDLIRIDTPQLPGQDDTSDEDEGEILGEGLFSFSLSYFSEDGEEFEEWSTGESSLEEGEPAETESLSLPALVRVELEFSADDGESEPTLFRTSIALPQVVGDLDQQEGT